MTVPLGVVVAVCAVATDGASAIANSTAKRTGRLIEISYTVGDLERFPDDGNRYELLDGVLLVTPQAALVHQVVANRIQFELGTALQKPGLAHVVGPGAVIRMPRTQLQPDILVFPTRFSPI